VLPGVHVSCRSQLASLSSSFSSYRRPIPIDC
jgi:hypothetical protein